MKAYSEDLRLRVVAAVDGGMPRAAVARVFEVGSATITRYLRLRRETGGLGPRPRHGPPPIKTAALRAELLPRLEAQPDRKSTRLNSSHTVISYAVFCLKKKKEENERQQIVTGQIEV